MSQQRVRFYKKESAASDAPSITASNVNIDYDVTGGDIFYTINNGVDGGVLNASVTDGDWLTLSGTNFESPIAFTCDANTVNTARTATVTLTYSYGNNETVTKDVIVTQAAAPVIYTTIPELFAAATSTDTDVLITFNNWVISAVRGNNAYLTDNQGNGLIIYASGHGFQVNNVLSGTANCKLVKYQGSAELKDLTSATAGLTVTAGGTVTEQSIDIDQLTGVNTGALVQYNNLTCSIDNSGTTPKYYLTDGTTTLQVYNSLYADTYSTLVEGKTYNIKGIYLQFNTTKEILPRSADDIVEVVSEEPSITVSPAEVNATAEETDGTLAISYENLEISDVTDFEVQYYDVTGAPISSEPEWVAVEVMVGTAGYEVSYIIENNTNSEERTAYFKVMALDNDANEVYSNLVTVTPFLPESVTNIQDRAFKYCPILESDLTLGMNRRRSVTFGGEAHFVGDNAIRKVTMGPGVASVPKYCLFTMSGLEEAELLADTVALGEWAFHDTQVKTVKFGGFPTFGVAPFHNHADYTACLYARWQAFMADPDEMTPWADLGETLQNQYWSRYPDGKTPKGMTLKTTGAGGFGRMWVFLWSPRPTATILSVR